MSTSKSMPAPDLADGVEFDAVVVGAGFGGLRMLHELRELGLSVKVLEAGTDVGGTWYWNRYPGARTDTESWAYIVNFSEELNAEWDWSERFPTQPEVLRYLRHVADRFDMRRDIQFNTRVNSAIYDGGADRWSVTTERGEVFRCTYLISASGLLSVGQEPPFPGLDSFQGEWYQTSNWPKEPVDLTGKRVAVVGTGATAVQVIPEVAHVAEHVTVFQRTPNYVMPARNHPLTDARRAEIKRNYNAIWQQACRQVFAFPMDPAGRTIADVTPAERQQVLEAGWEAGGFRYIFETFDDMLVDEDCNAAAAEFAREKIRAIVKDPATAELLCPDYPIAAKRPPLGHFYYEAFNRENVTLVDVSDSPIREVTRTGLSTQTDDYEFDVIIFAVGFDAATGALMHMDVRGAAGETITDKWAAGPQTYLGICVAGFPNMFMISGPQSPFANIPVVIDNMVRWIGEAITHIRENGYARMEATREAEADWGVLIKQLLDATILGKGAKVHSWFLGANIPGKPVNVLFYFGGAGNYFDHCQRVLDAGFEGISFSRQPQSVPAPA
jgi:cyclohexanone monooxygenase